MKTTDKPIKLSPSTREEWLRLRQGIGSSEVATIVGLNPWETPYELWLRKRDRLSSKRTTFAMQAGQYLEDAVAQFWQQETGRQIIKSSSRPVIYVHPKKDYLRVSPDRTYWLGASRSDEAKGVLECKTTQKSIDEDHLPEYWLCQIQYQLGVMQQKYGSIAWLISGRSFGYKDIELAPSFFELLVNKVDEFWQDNVLGGKEPDALNVSDIIRKYGQHTKGKVVAADAALYECYQELKKVRSEMDVLSERKEGLENQIKMHIRDGEVLNYRGQILATWKTTKEREQFDSESFKESHPELYSQFARSKPGFRQFVLK